MAGQFWCARCGQKYTLRPEMVGRQSRCRVCGQVQRVPEPLEPPAAAGAYDLAPEPAPAAPPPLPGPVVPAKGRGHPSASAVTLRAVLGETSRVQELSALLVVLSVADLLMTYLLLRTSPTFYESNPIALWVFRRWNIAGMAVFKFSVIGGAIAIGEYVERRRPGWGQAVLLIGCVAAGIVFWHGLRLYLGFGPPPADG